MIFKDIDFKKTPKLLINEIEYNFSNKIHGSQKNFNKGVINYENVIAKNLTTQETIDKFTIFPKFSRVEHYYGEKLFFLGFIKMQKGTANPLKPKYISITVLDGKDWLTQSEMIDEIFINVPYENVVDAVISKINLPFIKKGKMQFGNGVIEAWDSAEVDAYSVLRFIEKQSNTFLEIFLEKDKTYSINFFNKAEIGDKNGNKGVDLFIENDENIKKFNDNYELLDINWTKSSMKDFNVVRVSSEKIISQIAVKQIIDLNVATEIVSVFEKVAQVDKIKSYLANSNGEKVRNIKILENKEAEKGKNYDLSYSINGYTIKIIPKLLNKDFLIVFVYYPIRRGTVEFQDVQDQNKIANYTKGSGKKSRYEKHNDAGVAAHLIKYAKRYLELGIEKKIELNVILSNPPWNIGQHVQVKHKITELNGIYYVKSVSIHSTNNPNGVIVATYNYILTKTSDFEENLNFYDDQSYRQKPVLNIQKSLSTFESFSAETLIIAEKSIQTCIYSWNKLSNIKSLDY